MTPPTAPTSAGTILARPSGAASPPYSAPPESSGPGLNLCGPAGVFLAVMLMKMQSRR